MCIYIYVLYLLVGILCHSSAVAKLWFRWIFGKEPSPRRRNSSSFSSDKKVREGL